MMSSVVVPHGFGEALLGHDGDDGVVIAHPLKHKQCYQAGKSEVYVIRICIKAVTVLLPSL